MLKIKGLSRPGVEPFDLELDDGECVALFGASGAGKTLLLRAIVDLDPNVGDVSFDQTSRNDVAAPEWRRTVGYLAAESGWWSDDVGRHFPDHDRAGALLEKLGVSAEALGWQVDRLSTGERQRLAFARLLLAAPKVMLLDEPTSALDPEATAMVENILTRRLGEGVSILIVTHAREQAERLASRRFRMTAGVVQEENE